jgi:thymidylate synthase
MKGAERINATTLDDAWFQALSLVMEEGRIYKIDKGSFEGIHRQGMKLVINIMHPGVRPLAPIVPSDVPEPTTEQKIEEYYQQQIVTNIKGLNEHYTYGEDLWWELGWVIEHYKNGGFGNNHCFMTVGRPESLFFYDRDVDYEEIITVRDRQSGQLIWERKISNEWNKDPKNDPSSQCLRGIDTWIEEEKLHFWVYFRSWDLLSGFPQNLGGFQLLKEEMAKQIGVGDGMIIASGKDLHVYEHSWAIACLRLRKELKDVQDRKEA